MRFSEDRLARLKCSDKVERPVHVWEPSQPRAVILALHGGMAHAGDYVTPALYFRDKGIATVSYDMHGHDGKRRVDIPGFETFLDDGELFLRWVKKHYDGLPIFVMGHSMGALIATWLGLDRFPRDPDIKGFILSSPYYVNAIKVPKLLLTFSDLVAKLAPTAKVPIGSFTNVLTHDRKITERHLADERDGIRAVEATMRFASALSAAQAGLPSRISAWRYPMFAVVAGDDKLADAGATETILKTIDPTLLEYHFHANNYHENFNEINRDTIFADILRWMEDRMANSQDAQAQPVTAANGI